jgi:hypothetical protein
MDPVAFAARLYGSDNPIAPYTWSAEYRGGGGLRQYDVDGRHTSLEIDRTRIAALVLHGHPAGALRLPVPDALGAPDAVIVKATTSVRLRLGGSLERAVRVTAGFQVGAQRHVLVIEDDGRINLSGWRR